MFDFKKTGPGKGCIKAGGFEVFGTEVVVIVSCPVWCGGTSDEMSFDFGLKPGECAQFELRRVGRPR